MSDIVKKDETILPMLMEQVKDKIVEVRGQQVLLDRDVAALYGVETREVNQAVRNNPGKFREGYIFELTTEESAVLRSNYLTLEHEKGKGRYSKYNFKAFTERGLYMLATILRSKRAEDATVAIVETFYKVRMHTAGNEWPTLVKNELSSGRVPESETTAKAFIWRQL